ncbi:TIGR01440 family protein [Paenibacillus sp. GSMTC-2017]|uniref:TIGR01440 family protein n=1 Tax=Paenibacillus sp. GSMTC-2017 TaxID=2794350 RepID=UPI0018D984EE|nr:TIGR01440 family protein [Paenibacillus sp. GSMTC-2017]MBH5320549.1 TIGR01440 family protein [Paenibacillus sp. GSMTC-2017]
MSELSEETLKGISNQVQTIVRELAEAGKLSSGQLLVIGASTSEVIGHRIGTAGAVEAAAAIFAGVESVRRDIPFIPVFQCCEHLNRALVIEQSAALQLGLELVHAIPVPKAGGSMAAYAYGRFVEPCLVESIEAHAGIDIGDTFIGMHLKRVAVPIRPSTQTIGSAHVTMAITRPKLIGGVRAVYDEESKLKPEQSLFHCE